MSQATISATLRAKIDSMAGVIPAVSILASTPGAVALFQTVSPHGLVPGLTVKVDGHVGCSPAVGGSYTVSVVSPTIFSLKNAATGQAVSLASGGTGGTVKANLIAWGNLHYSPVIGVPYQRVHVVFAKPENPSFGSGHTREHGFLQVDLHYPKNTGTVALELRVEEIRNSFKYGDTMTMCGITTHVSGTPATLGGDPEDEFYQLSVRVPFWADVFV